MPANVPIGAHRALGPSPVPVRVRQEAVALARVLRAAAVAVAVAWDAALRAPEADLALVAQRSYPVLDVVGQAFTCPVRCALRRIEAECFGAIAGRAHDSAAWSVVAAGAVARAVARAALEAAAVAEADSAKRARRARRRAVRPSKTVVADALLLKRHSRRGRARVQTIGPSEADEAVVAQRSGPVPALRVSVAVALSDSVADAVPAARVG